MHTYAVLLGRQPLLSRAELAAVIPDFSPGRSFGNEYLIFKSNIEIDQTMFDLLGGSLLMARSVTEVAISIEDIPSLLAAELKNTKGKATFALRFFGIPRNKAHAMYRNCKKFLKKNGIPSRYIGSEREPVKSVQYFDAGLLNSKRGCELLILADEKQFWIGRTIVAQNIKEYAKRDMEKPVRDTRTGLLPPKLAQILLNLGAFLAGSGNPKFDLKKLKLTVLDPFCGTGVIPIEALIRHWRTLASDNSQKAVSGCSKNIEWTRKIFKVFKKDVDSEVWKQDATRPFTLKNPPDVIITESSLGPPLKDKVSIRDAERFLKNAEEIEAKFLHNCAATLPKVPIAMIWPVWYSPKRQFFLTKIIDVINETGYRMVLPPHCEPSLRGRLSLVYRRPDQIVGREVVLLKPVK